ncbi:MAG: PAS domain-containing protein [Chitinophagales bacterium]
MSNTTPSYKKNEYHFLPGSGEMSRRIRNYNWETTSLGSIDTWPQSLKTTLSIILNSKFPMLLFWGPDHICFYNDAYHLSLGNDGKYSGALGQKGIDCWPEIWSVVKPFIDQVLSGGNVSLCQDQLIPIYRNGKMEDVYWTFSYSAVTNESDNIGGVFVTCIETTNKISSLSKLTASDQQFQSLVKDISIGIILLSGPEMKVIVVNDAYCRLIDRTVDELLDKELFSIIPESEEHFRHLLEKVRVTGQPMYLYDFPHSIYIDGEKKSGYLNLVYQPYKEPNGEISGVMAFCHDVTIQVEARKKAEENNQNLRNIFEQAPMVMALVKGPEYIVDIMNSKCLEFLGRSKEEILGKPVFDVLQEIKGSWFEEKLGHVFHTGESFAAYGVPIPLMRFGKQETMYIHSAFEPYKDSHGSILGVMAIAVDITNEALIRKKMEAEKERTKLAIAAGELGVFEVDTVTDEMITDKRLNEIYGFEEQVDRQQYIDIIHPDDLQIRNKALIDAIHTKSFDFEIRFYHNITGMLRWVRCKGHVIEDENSHTKLFGVIQDITEQKMFEDALFNEVQERTLELSRSNEDLLRFVHVASHDLKEPARKVKTFATRLVDEYVDDLPEKATLYINKIINAADRMYAMIDGVLSYSTLNSIHQKIEELDLNEIIANIETDLEVLIQAKNCTIEKDELPNIEGASVLIYQLFYNLLNNSLKFSKADADTHISIKSSVVTENGKAYANIIITDNGIGIAPQYAEKIFFAFERLNSKDRYEGTGLGLSLCKKIVERHHGTISATGVEGEYAAFTIMLPVKQVEKTI